MPPIVLTTLKYLFLALLYLFIARAVRVVYLDLVGQRVPKPRGARQRQAPARRRGVPRSVVVTESEKPVRTFPLDDELTFGRADNCGVQLDDTYVSTLHARMFSKDGTWFVEDLGSTNGTYLNRKKVTAPIAIRKGDRLQIGKTVMELQ